MITSKKTCWAALSVLLAVALGGPASLAQDANANKVELSATDSAGKGVKVPLASRPTLLMFVRIDQPQSTEAVESTKAAVKDLPNTQVVVILSGKDIAEGAMKKFIADSPWPVVLDEDYSILGQLRVRVWPTSIVVMPDGVELVRLTGMPTSYVRDLNSYLAFAAGKITADTLKQRLSNSGIVADSAQQVAARHLLVAQRLLEKGLVDPAWKEISEALKLEPKDPRLQQAMARVLLMMDKPVEALAVLDKLELATPANGETKTLRGRAMVALKQWADAKAALDAAVKLNPNPAEAYYFLGLVYQQQKQPDKAAEAFRMAFEATDAGRRVMAPAAGPDARPETQPAAESSQPPAKPVN